jgi:hypothetical protein
MDDHAGAAGPLDMAGVAGPLSAGRKGRGLEFTCYRQGVLTHVLNRNLLANAHHAYALYWSTPASQWGRNWHIFTVLVETFRPAVP